MSICEKELLFPERKKYEEMFYVYCSDNQYSVHIKNFIVWMMCTKEGAELAQKVLNYHIQKAINKLDQVHG